jgi:hypothetical protein
MGMRRKKRVAVRVDRKSFEKLPEELKAFINILVLGGSGNPSGDDLSVDPVRKARARGKIMKKSGMKKVKRKK